MASRRYSIVIADRTSGVIRRFTLPLGPTVTTIVDRARLPILIGLGARWSARAALDELTATNASLTVENENYREATGQLSSQISALQAAVDEIGATAAVDPAASRAMERLPASVRSRAMGGGVAGDRPRQRPRPRRRGLRRDARRPRRDRAPARRRANRRRAPALARRRHAVHLAGRGLAHVGVRQPPRSVHRRQRLPSRPRHLGQPRRPGPRPGDRHRLHGRLERQLRQHGRPRPRLRHRHEVRPPVPLRA